MHRSPLVAVTTILFGKFNFVDSKCSGIRPFIQVNNSNISVATKLLISINLFISPCAFVSSKKPHIGGPELWSL
jgi:hypothetical protein